MEYKVIQGYSLGGPELVITDLGIILPLETKLCNSDPVPARPVGTICAIDAIPSAMLAVTLANMERRVGLSLQTEETQFHHLL
jgi:hypothetical protein